MARRIFLAIIVLILAGLLGWFVLSTNKATSHYAVKLGLDLAQSLSTRRIPQRWFLTKLAHSMPCET